MIALNKISWKHGGVYLILNTKTKMVYIGSSHCIRKRVSEHISRLKSGTHHNLILQAAWNKHTSKAFKFYGVEVLNNKALFTKQEQKWIDKYDSTNSKCGYNILPYAGRQLRVLGDCIICKRRNIKRRKGRCHSCDIYLTRFGKERPYIENGKIEKKIALGKQPCLRCERPLSVKGVGGHGLCKSCRRWRDRVYTNHDWINNVCIHCGLLKKRTSARMLYFINNNWISGRTKCSSNKVKYFN